MNSEDTGYFVLEIETILGGLQVISGQTSAFNVTCLPKYFRNSAQSFESTC